MRVAIYARYSSERQNERSTDDQIAVCSRHAELQGWTVVTAFMDAAISGAALANRPGLLAAVASAERGEIDVLLCEDEDRIARNMEHLAHVVNRLRFARAKLATLTNPDVQGMAVAFKGFMAEDFLRNLGQKTARGMRSNAEKGLATGSRLYGYRSQAGGAVEIVEAEAEVIRRIFTRFIAGESPRRIASALNQEGVASPHGGQWNASSINGSRQRRNGILQSDIYAGVKVYNRWDMRKDNQTGKRMAHIRPESEWQKIPVPHLRIVDDETWRAAQAKKAISGANQPLHLHRRPTTLLSGLVKCGVCGSSYTAAHGARLRCSARIERGDDACWNRRTLLKAELEQELLETLRTRLLSPAAVRAYVRTYHRLWDAKKRASADQRGPLEKRLAEVERRIGRAIDAIVNEGVAAAAMKDRLAGLETEKAMLAQQLAVMGEQRLPVDMHPNVADGYARKIEQLQAMLETKGDTGPMNELKLGIRGLVEKIVVTPASGERGAPVSIELYGKIGRFLDAAAGRGAPSMRLLVAGGRIELPT